MEINERAMLRKLERMAVDRVSEDRMMQLGAAQGRFAPSTPREMLQAEQDAARSRLAAELLKITAERMDDLAAAARAALDAAALIYPELPPEADKEGGRQ